MITGELVDLALRRAAVCHGRRMFALATLDLDFGDAVSSTTASICW